ncbi:hypothetical protein SBY92_000254 [Candida maltosa Xu316]
MPSPDRTAEIENLRTFRAALEAIRESTEKILEDLTTIHKENNPTLLENAKEFRSALNYL